MKVDQARDGADALRRFAAELARRGRPDRIQVRLDGEDGLARLCAIEAAMAALWPSSPAKELVWLTGSGTPDGDLLQLQAFAADGEVLGTAAYRLARMGS